MVPWAGGAHMRVFRCMAFSLVACGASPHARPPHPKSHALELCMNVLHDVWLAAWVGGALVW